MIELQQDGIGLTTCLTRMLEKIVPNILRVSVSSQLRLRDMITSLF
jgi:hypothetical protein